MNHNTQRTLACALAVLLAACGGRDTMASKSAAAYAEAQKKGTPAGGDGQAGHEHGGAAATETTPATDHAAHEGMDHSAHAAVEHADHGAPAEHAAMTDHGAMTGHATMTDHATMQHGHVAPPASAAGSGLAAADGGATHNAMHAAPATSAHAHHGAPAATPPLPLEPAPANPDALLRPDAFDAPAASSVAEAAKAQHQKKDQR